MEIFEAFKYRRPFLFSGKRIIPSENINYFIVRINNQSYLAIKEDDNELIVKPFSKYDGKIGNRINTKKFLSSHNFRFAYFYGSVEEVFEIKADFTLTSEGFIDIEKLYLAQDIYNGFTFLKKREIEDGYKYLDISGRKMIYIKDRSNNYNDQFFSLKNSYLYNRESIKIIEKIGKINNEDKVIVNYTLNFTQKY